MLSQCESSDNYAAKSANRRYFGAYQFSRATWDDVAGRYYPWLEGVGPHKASPAEQDAMTEMTTTILSGAAELRVPLEINLAFGDSWAAAKA